MNSQTIVAGWLIDGSGGPIRESVLLRVVGGVVREMRSLSRSERAGLPGPLLDLSHCVLLPPLVDSHVHLFLSATTDRRFRKAQLSAEYATARPLLVRHLLDLFKHGVLAVRDGGDAHGHALRLFEEQEAGAGDIPPVTLQVSGRAWHAPGRYGSLIGRTPRTGEPLAGAVARTAAEGGLVKIALSGPNSLRQFARETTPQFSVEEVRAAVLQAERLGKSVMAHANGREPVRVALEGGCRSIEHGFFMGRENLQRMADLGAVWVPTVYTMKALRENLEPGEGEPAVAQRTLDHQLEQLFLARELGVRVALGTDAGCIGVLHGESVVEELKLLIRAGYSLSEAIHCATAAGAALLDLEGWGTIAPGHRASFLVARGTPAQLPRKLSYLEGIHINGQPCSRSFFTKV